MLVIAVFIMVVMALLAGGLSRVLQNSSETLVVEVVGTRAFYAAQTGLELGLIKLYPLNNLVGQCSSANPLSDPPSYTFGELQQGLEQCKVWLDCISSLSSENPSVTHYRLTSVGQCDAGTIQTSRTIQMEVWQ